MGWTQSLITPKKRLQFCGIVSLTLVLISGQYLFFHLITKNTIRSKQQNICTPESKVGKLNDEARKIILVSWISLMNYNDPLYWSEFAKYCPKCLFTENTSYYNVSDAVVYHAENERPQILTRPKNQIWVWYYLEPPPMPTIESRRVSNESRLNVFNWTMHYRKDSDIFLPYGGIFPFERPSVFSSPDEKWSYIVSEQNRNNGVYNLSLMPVPTIQELQGRKLVSWIVTNCNSSSGRDLIAKELSKYVQVDIYGSCGPFRCPSRYGEMDKGIDCRTSIATNYKFYLAFENTSCEDYVTEKFFRTLRTQMVPIVYGGANYSAIAPKNSYINVMDFESVKDLADYLIYLDTNPVEYLKYFEWRKHYWVEQYRLAVQFCTLCDKLWSISENGCYSKSYTNIVKWWKLRSDRQDPLNGENGNACVSPRKLKIFANISSTNNIG